jgi:nucleoside-diphosphate-sugar epimerase
VDTSAGQYYGKGYQDVQHRTPDITNTCAELGWEPRMGMQAALATIFDAYRHETGDAGDLINKEPAPGPRENAA